MSASSLSGGSIRILWDASTSAEVTISGPGTEVFTVNGGAITFPYTLSASTTFDTNNSGTYDVSVKHHGYEAAGTPDGTRTCELSFGQQVIFAPTPDGTPHDKVLSHLSVTYGRPRHVRIDCLATPKSTVGFVNLSQNSGYWYAGAIDNGAGVQNDEIEFEAALEAGTYTLDVFHRLGTNRGIYTVLIDGVALGSTIDGYNAAASNVRTSLTGIVVANAGMKSVKVRMATKNASSTAYVGLLSALIFTRTA